ncbi:MAG: hypothetical protein QM723_03800 [Myxococcaceae bacterium]
MLAAVLLAALTAAPAVGTKGLSTFGVKADVGEFFTNTLQKELRERGVVLQLRPDANPEAPICENNTPCAFFVRGTLAQLGDKTRLELELVGGDGKRLSRHSTIGADVASLADRIPPLAEELAQEIKAAGPQAITEQTAPPPAVVPAPAPVPVPEPAPPSAVQQAAPRPTRLWWTPLLGTIVFGAASAGCFAVAQSDHSSLTSGGRVNLPVYSYADARAIADHGKLFDTLGWVSLGLAGATVITAAVLWLITRSSP